MGLLRRRAVRPVADARDGLRTRPMSAAPPPVRRCARALVVDERGHVLLLRSSAFFACRRTDAGEAAARELCGLRVGPGGLVGPVGARRLGRDDRVCFLLRANRFEARFDWSEGAGAHEITGSAWRTVDERRAVDRGGFPVPVGDLVKRPAGGDDPASPVEPARTRWGGAAGGSRCGPADESRSVQD